MAKKFTANISEYHGGAWPYTRRPGERITCEDTGEVVSTKKVWADKDGNLYTLRRMWGKASFWVLSEWETRRLNELRRQGRSKGEVMA